MNDRSIVRLSRHPSFATLTADQLDALSADATAVTYGPDERLFAEGGVADAFWLIERGSVAIDMRVPGRGDQVVETLVGATVLGWSWLHPPYRWHYGAVTRAETAAIVFDAEPVRRRCDADPAFGYAILRCFTPVIVERLQATRLRMLDLYATPDQAGQRAGEPR